MVSALADAFNEPSRDITFPRYHVEAECEAWKPGLYHLLYLVLALGGPASLYLLR